jgi:CheY-like chemotaxis protein
MKRILIVEDIPDTLSGIASALVRKGVAVESVSNIAEAVERLNSIKYDALLLDWRLPQNEENPDEIIEDGGAVVLKALSSGKTEALNQDVPVIVVSARPSGVHQKTVQSFRNCGKPISKMRILEIRQAIEETLGLAVPQSTSSP